MRRILVVCAHPDDESLGCGGGLLLHAAAGDVVDVVFLTSGERGGHGLSLEETKRVREQEARDACDVLGVRDIDFWHYPDGALSVEAILVERLGDELRGRHPDRVYVTHPGDDHPDHAAAAAAVIQAMRHSGSGAEVMFTEIWTPLSRFSEVVDISAHLQAKLRAVACHATQCAVMDFQAAVRSLNRYRGEMHLWPGGPYAEVYSRWSP